MRKILILGVGCSICEALAARTETAVRALGLDYSLERIGDIDKILEFGPVMLPALVMDGQLKFAGRLPTVEELKRLLA